MVRKIVFAVFVLTVLLAPLPFASNRPWSWSLLSALIGLLLVAEALTGFDRTVPARSFLKKIWPGLAVWLTVALWMWVQSLPGLPPEIAHPLYAEATAQIGAPSLSAISLDPYATRTALMRFLAYGAVFWMAARFCHNRDRAAVVLRWFVIASGLYALYGLIVFFLGLETILWFDKWAHRGDLTSTFTNRNNYATFAGVGALASAALTFDVIGSRLQGQMTWRETLREFIEAVFSKAWLPFLCFLLTTTAVLLSHSRGGFLSTSLALTVLLILFFLIRLVPGKIGGSIVAAIVVGSLFAFSTSGRVVIDRLSYASTSTGDRGEVYARTLDAITANPVLGTGYGTFEDAFRAYKTDPLAWATWDKTHNSYLELAMELGIPATLLLSLGFLWLAAIFIYGLGKRRRHRVYPALGLAALVLATAHATVDFSLQIPGFTVCFALLMGVAWAQSWPTRSWSGRQNDSSSDYGATG